MPWSSADLKRLTRLLQHRERGHRAHRRRGGHGLPRLRPRFSWRCLALASQGPNTRPANHAAFTTLFSSAPASVVHAVAGTRDDMDGDTGGLVKLHALDRRRLLAGLRWPSPRSRSGRSQRLRERVAHSSRPAARRPRIPGLELQFPAPRAGPSPGSRSPAASRWPGLRSGAFWYHHLLALPRSEARAGAGLTRRAGSRARAALVLARRLRGPVFGPGPPSCFPVLGAPAASSGGPAAAGARGVAALTLTVAGRLREPVGARDRASRWGLRPPRPALRASARMESAAGTAPHRDLRCGPAPPDRAHGGTTRSLPPARAARIFDFVYRPRRRLEVEYHP